MTMHIGTKKIIRLEESDGRVDHDGHWPGYPKMECEKHGPNQQGYVVCVHVVEGSRVAYSEEPSSKGVGVLLCFACGELWRQELFEPSVTAITCRQCVTEHGLLPN